MIRRLFGPPEDLSTLTDTELVERFAKGKEAKYLGELYKRYAHLVQGVGLKYLKNIQGANDLVSDIFEGLFSKLSKQSEIKNFKGWLYYVAKNECISRLRKNKYNVSFYGSAEEFPKETADDFVEYEKDIRLTDATHEETDVQKLAKAIGQLKEDQQTCIKAFYLEEMSYKEIADELGYTLKQVKSFVQNGKRNLRIILEKNK